jgi:predicted transcriptional regulator
MGQEEIYAILQSEPEDWFDSEELSELTNISQTAVSRCLRRLNYDGFIIEGSEGSKKIYRFNPEKVWN